MTIERYWRIHLKRGGMYDKIVVRLAAFYYQRYYTLLHATTDPFSGRWRFKLKIFPTKTPGFVVGELTGEFILTTWILPSRRECEKESFYEEARILIRRQAKELVDLTK